MVQLGIISSPYNARKIAFIILLACHSMAYSQEADSLKTDTFTANKADSLKTDEFTANIGLGIGNFTFFGDVGKDFAKHNPLVSNLGYQLRVSTAFSQNIDFSFNALFGKLTINERFNTRNLNFQTQIRGGGIELVYSFKNLLGPKRTIYPYVSAGISSFEFLSKTDLYDRNGNEYNYWSDGSIRDLPQTDPNAADAQIITQDYVYESDLRELNLDNFGDYRERTFSYPLGIGVQMPVTEKVNFRIGTSIFFNQTDLIDNVTDESINERAGDNKKDRFLFSSFSISYNISLPSKTKQDLLNEELLAVSNESDREDEDGDGVFDIVDNCPHTPKRASVDEHGCPIDTDKDFIANYRDKEIRTPEHMEVDTLGIGLDDNYFLKKFQNYQKLWGEPNVLRGIVESGSESLSFMALKKVNENALVLKAKLEKENRDISIHNRRGQFSVLLGATKDGITEEMSMLLLSVPDVSTLEIGDSTYYITQTYSQLEDAVLRQMSLFIDSVGGKVVEIRDDRIISLDDETQDVQDDILHAPELIDKDSRGITYRVQLGAFKNDSELSLYEYVDDVIKLKGKDGLTRYLSGSYKDPQKAAEHKIDLLIEGYTGAFLSAYKDGERIELEEVGIEVLQKINYNKLWNEVNKDAFDKNFLEYRILLGKFEGVVPPRMVNKFITLGEVDPLRIKSEVYYLKGHYKDQIKAKEALKDAIQAGIIAAKIVGEYKGKVISFDEVERMMEEY